MEFQIRQGATDPILKFKMIQNGLQDKVSFDESLLNATITFDMVDYKTGEYEILNEECNLVLKSKIYHQTSDEYYITYRFKDGQTDKIGKYEGKIKIQFRDINLSPTNTLIFPVREKLFINIF